MAISQNTLIGRVKNSVGEVTFSTWFSKNIIRSKPSTQHNPNTALQQTQRSIFRAAIAFYKQHAEPLNYIFTRVEGKYTANSKYATMNSQKFVGTENKLLPITTGILDFGTSIQLIEPFLSGVVYIADSWYVQGDFQLVKEYENEQFRIFFVFYDHTTGSSYIDQQIPVNQTAILGRWIQPFSNNIISCSVIIKTQKMSTIGETQTFFYNPF